MIQTLPQPAFSQSTQTTTYPVSLQYLINQLQQTPQLTPERITQLIKAANIPVQDLMPWADFDHPVEDSYGRKLVFDGGHFEIMVMSWLPGDFSAIHDHGSTQWGAVQSFGAAEHYIYHLSAEQHLSAPIAAPYFPGMVRGVDHDLIHQMGNASDQPFLSLHVYGCAGAAGNITGNARIFDLFENSIQHTDGGVFFCLPEAQINHRVYGLTGDMQATLLHNRLMCDRLQRILRNK